MGTSTECLYSRLLDFCRSLAACEQLYNAGFRNLFWVQGGLEAAEDEVIELCLHVCGPSHAQAHVFACTSSIFK